MSKNNNTELVPAFGVMPSIELPDTLTIERASLKQRDRLLAKAKTLKPIEDVPTLEATVAVGLDIRRSVKTVQEVYQFLKGPLEEKIQLLATLRDRFIR